MVVLSCFNDRKKARQKRPACLQRLRLRCQAYLAAVYFFVFSIEIYSKLSYFGKHRRGDL